MKNPPTIIAAGLLASVTAWQPLAAHAGDIPSFLSAGQTYAEKQEYCLGPDEEAEFERPMNINAEGMSAHESGCQFVEYKPIIHSFDEPGAEPDSYLVTAACGDDSGITRPDIFHLYHYEGTLRLTSQNDYMYDLLRPREDDDWETWGFVNLEFTMCQPK